MQNVEDLKALESLQHAKQGDENIQIDSMTEEAVEEEKDKQTSIDEQQSN